MKRLLPLLALLALPGAARAEGPWVGTAAHPADGTAFELRGGTRTLEAAALRGNGRVADGLELVYAFPDRVTEVRGARSWRLTAPDRIFAVSAQAGASVLFVGGPFDLGLGPHGALVLGWQGAHVAFDLGAQAGAEIFFRTGGPRFPLRLLTRLGLRFGRFGVGLAGRAGVDLEPGRFFALRYEALLVVRFAP